MNYIVKTVVMIGTNENVNYAEKPNLDEIYRYRDELKAIPRNPTPSGVGQEGFKEETKCL